MSDYEQNILNRIGGLHAEAQKREMLLQQEQQRLREQQQKSEADARASVELGRQALRILDSRNVDTIPVIVRRDRSDYTHEVGRGWHVMTMQEYEGADAPTSSRFFGLNTRGDFLSFTQTAIMYRGTRLEGIIQPKTVSDGTGKLKLLQSEAWQNGIASLIGGLGPYEDPKPVSFW